MFFTANGITTIQVDVLTTTQFFNDATGLAGLSTGNTVSVGGLLFNTPPPPSVFRIDHDQAFQQSTHIQYQWKKTGPWVGFNWRYDSGLVAGAVPFATDSTTPVDLTVLTPDQQVQAGLFCGNVFATLSAPRTQSVAENPYENGFSARPLRTLRPPH